MSYIIKPRRGHFGMLLVVCLSCAPGCAAWSGQTQQPKTQLTYAQTLSDIELAYNATLQVIDQLALKGYIKPGPLNHDLHVFIPKVSAALDAAKAAVATNGTDQDKLVAAAQVALDDLLRSRYAAELKAKELGYVGNPTTRSNWGDDTGVRNRSAATGSGTTTHP